MTFPHHRPNNASPPCPILLDTSHAYSESPSWRGNRASRRSQNTRRNSRSPLPSRPTKARNCRHPSTELPPATGACMSALGLAAVSGFAEVMFLERTCLELSNACREGAPWAVSVYGVGMPPKLARQFLRKRGGSGGTGAGGNAGGGSAGMSAGKGKGRLGRRGKRAGVRVGAGTGAESRLIERKLVKHLLVKRVRRVGDLLWPPGVEKVVFFDLDHAVEHVAWPETLVEVSLFGGFNKPIERAAWPASLRVLELSTDFNHPVEEMKLPDGMERLVFGHKFNQPIARVRWPQHLRALSFGSCFNK